MYIFQWHELYSPMIFDMVVIVQRTVEISWKPSYGNYVQMQHGVIPEEFCPWKTAYNRFNRWASKGLWGKFF